uniref:Hematopoietic SH2 domain-containing protein homolog n=1 Tax=Seriola dumerili TaxID=41447 RepID=A0A3B4U6K1_SERDU
MMEWNQSLQGQHDAFTWFTESQLRSVIRNGIVPEWFHGIISRKTAEELLMSKPSGYFLIRVSETRIGYSLSYRADDRCRHFMIDALEDGHYIIVGENRRHRFLQDLVDFHRRNPIMPFTEVLTVACGQVRECLYYPTCIQMPELNGYSIHHRFVCPSTAMATEVKPSVVTNLKNLKKKFQKKRSTSQEHMYTEIDTEATDRGGNADNEYQEITQEETFNSAPFSYIHNNVPLTDGALPQEYLPPPPFAPGY